MKKALLFFIISFFMLIKASANIYYVSNAGDDNNSGLSKQLPFESLKHASKKVSPGDVILLHRGDIFRESVEIVVKNVEINAYGSIDKPLPVISGAALIKGFKPYRDGLYVAKTEVTPGYLFVDNLLMTIARYPNDDWLRTKYWEDTRLPRGATEEQLAQPNTMVQCPELTENPNNSDDFWIGANIKWRHHSWWFETRQVVDYDATGKLFLNDRSFSIQNPNSWIKKGWGFYLDNKLELLDTPGEWYFDKQEKLVYLYPPEGKIANEFVVEGSVRNFGLKITDGIVQHIRFQHQQDIGLWIDGISVVQYCEFEGIGRDAKVSERGEGGSAIRAENDTRNTRISHNTFSNNFNNAIVWWQNPNDTTSSIIERNLVQNTGIVHGYGGSGAWHAVAILIGSGRNVHVQYNTIEKSGYVGILLGTDGNFAEYNIIKNAMYTLNDGGGIYTNCSRSTIRYNIIIDTKGGMESSGSWATIAHGIWPEFLHEYRENIIEFNTVIGSGGDGIFLPNNFNCVIRNNVCYNNERYQLVIMGKGNRQINVKQNHLILGNIFYAATPSQNALYFDDRIHYGLMKDNYYCKPFSNELIREGKDWPGVNQHQSFTITDWQKQYNWADSTPFTDIKKISEDKQDGSEIFINQTEQNKTFILEGKWLSISGKTVTGSIILEPFTSKILIKI